MRQILLALALCLAPVFALADEPMCEDGIVEGAVEITGGPLQIIAFADEGDRHPALVTGPDSSVHFFNMSNIVIGCWKRADPLSNFDIPAFTLPPFGNIKYLFVAEHGPTLACRAHNPGDVGLLAFQADVDCGD